MSKVKIDICPKCNGNVLNFDAKNEIKSLLNQYDNELELMNPGGREFLVTFNGKKKRIQITDYCYECDLAIVKKALELN